MTVARPDVSQVWSTDRLWAPIYAFALNRPPLARLGAAVVFRTDFEHLYRALDVIATVPDGGVILDIPCGGGVALRALNRRQDVRYIAADIAPDMLVRTAAEAARRELEQVETLAADITALPFGDAAFDLVVSFTSLHCLPDPEAAVLELGRVTKPGAEIAGSLWCADVRLTQRPLQIVARRAGLVGPSATPEQLRGWLGAAGFPEPAFRRSGDFLYFRARRG